MRRSSAAPCRQHHEVSVPRAATRRQHPWFTLHLPRYLAVMQADTIATAAQVGLPGPLERTHQGIVTTYNPN